MNLIKNNGRFEFRCNFQEKDVPKGAGFRWDGIRKIWYTTSVEVAEKLSQYASEDIFSDVQDQCKIKLVEETIFNKKYWVCVCDYEHRMVAKTAGFWFMRTELKWVSQDPECAIKLKDYASESIKANIVAEYEKKMYNLECSKLVDADIVIPSPERLNYLGFQRGGIKYAIERGNTLIADEMGLGKTIQAIGVYNSVEEARKWLVVCPAYLKNNWRKEINKWNIKGTSVDICKSGKDFPKSDIVIINYEIMEKFANEIRNTEWDLFVADEVHYCKNYKSKRTVFTLGGTLTLKDQKTKKTTEITVPRIKATRNILLTGTPILNRPVELWPLVNFLDPSRFNKFMPFAKRYCNAHSNGFGLDVTGSSNLEELQKELRSRFMIRRLKKDVMTELPKKMRQIIEIGEEKELVSREMKEAQSRFQEIEALVVALEISKASSNKQDYVAAVEALKDGYAAMFKEIAKIRHEIAERKVKYVVDHLVNIVESGNKVICFTHHIDISDLIFEELQKQGINAVVAHSKKTMDQREEAVNKFQTDDKCMVFVGTMRACGVGITLTAASHVVFAEIDWVPAVISQAEDRSHRYGQLNSVLVQHIVFEGSLDAYMVSKVVSKQEVIDAALDDEIIIQEPVSITLSDIISEEPRKQKKDIGTEVVYSDIDRIEDYFRNNRNEIQIVEDAINNVMSYCDGAFERDNQGFNKVDSAVARNLMDKGILEPREAAYSLMMVRKYRRQLSSEILESVEKIIKANLKTA